MNAQQRDAEVQPRGGGREGGGRSNQASENTQAVTLDQTLMQLERKEILAALHRANGKRTVAARILGISRSRLYRRMEALGIRAKNADTGPEA